MIHLGLSIQAHVQNWMTRHFEKWRWKQFKKSDLKDGECYVVLDGENVFVNRPSEPWRHDLPNTESFSEVGK